MNRWGLILLVVVALTTTGCSGFVSGANTSALVAPMVTLQPANQTVTAGETAALSVSAHGNPPLSHQREKKRGGLKRGLSSHLNPPGPPQFPTRGQSNPAG